MSKDFERLMTEQIAWAHEYNGYARLAGTPEALGRLLEPAWREYRSTGRIPEWCGVDLLRSWAFYITRADRHGGGYDLSEGGAMLGEWHAVLERISVHDGAIADDLPPMNGGPRPR